MKLAVIADVHGNIWALEAVLADIARRNVRDIVNLGDSLAGPLAARETADCLMDRAILCIRGNTDREILSARRDSGFVSPSVDAALQSLETKHLDWLASHKTEATIETDVLLTHGAPGADTTYLLHDVIEGWVVPRPDKQVADLIKTSEPRLVLCGHTHVAAIRALPVDRLVVNPGSVGLPAYTHDVPQPHAMESGSPHARYAVIERRGLSWLVEHVAVPYDVAAAVDVASVSGRSDWASWLATGRAGMARFA